MVKPNTAKHRRPVSICSTQQSHSKVKSNTAKPQPTVRLVRRGRAGSEAAADRTSAESAESTEQQTDRRTDQTNRQTYVIRRRSVVSGVGERGGLGTGYGGTAQQRRRPLGQLRDARTGAACQSSGPAAQKYTLIYRLHSTVTLHQGCARLMNHVAVYSSYSHPELALHSLYGKDAVVGTSQWWRKLGLKHARSIYRYLSSPKRRARHSTGNLTGP